MPLLKDIRGEWIHNGFIFSLQTQGPRNKDTKRRRVYYNYNPTKDCWWIVNVYDYDECIPAYTFILYMYAYIRACTCTCVCECIYNSLCFRVLRNEKGGKNNSIIERVAFRWSGVFLLCEKIISHDPPSSCPPEVRGHGHVVIQIYS